MYKVEFNTKEEWLIARKGCLTGTTIGKYIGIESPFIPKSDAEMAKNPAVNFGVNCENSIITIFKHLPVIAQQTLILPTLKHTLWYADRDNRLSGSFDALATEKGKNGFCEVKSTGAGIYDLRNMIIPETTWLQIIHYFSIDESLDFCYLIVCDYPSWGHRQVYLDWVRISRESVMDRITNLIGWQDHLLASGVR